MSLHVIRISRIELFQCVRLGRDTTNGLRSTWQIHSFHVSPKSPTLAQTHRLIRSGGLSLLKDGSGKPTAAPHPNELDPRPNLIDGMSTQKQSEVLFFWNKNSHKKKQSEDFEKLKKAWLHTAPLMALLFCGIEQTAVSLPKAKP